MRKIRMAMVAGGALLAATSVAGAQRGQGVPPGQMPSPGMCRVWIDGVPPGRQPAQTDCETARRTAPANSRILYGASTNGTQTDPRRTGTMGTYDPRRTGTTGTSDPRRTTDGRYDPNGRYPVSEQERIARERRQAQWEREQQQKERERLAGEQRKYDRQQRKEQEKAWKKGHKKDHDDEDDDHERGDRKHDVRRGDEGRPARSDGRYDARIGGSGTATTGNSRDPRKHQ